MNQTKISKEMSKKMIAITPSGTGKVGAPVLIWLEPEGTENRERGHLSTGDYEP
jgi:hypothetical protein